MTAVRAGFTPARLANLTQYVEEHAVRAGFTPARLSYKNVKTWHAASLVKTWCATSLPITKNLVTNNKIKL